MVVGRAVRVRRHVPARRKDEEVGERRSRIARGRSQDAKDGRIDVINADAPDVHKFGQVVLEGHLVWKD